MKALKRLIEAPRRLNKRRVKYPTLAEVLYVPPMKAPFKGQGRKCSNCMLWVPKGPNRCSILGPDVEAKAGAVCGYHVPGAPMRGEWQDHPGGMQYIPPKLAGLEMAPEAGTMCGNCDHLHADRCLVVVGEDGRKAKVHPLGCCNRWEG